jgi:hypothetical protein
MLELEFEELPASLQCVWLESLSGLSRHMPVALFTAIRIWFLKTETIGVECKVFTPLFKKWNLVNC